MKLLFLVKCYVSSISKDRKKGKHKYFPYELKNATLNVDVILDRNAFFTQNSFPVIKDIKTFSSLTWLIIGKFWHEISEVSS